MSSELQKDPVRAIQAVAPADLAKLMKPGPGFRIEIAGMPAGLQPLEQGSSAQEPSLWRYVHEGTRVEAECRLEVDEAYGVAVMQVAVTNRGRQPVTLSECESLSLRLEQPQDGWRCLQADGCEPRRVHDHDYPPRQFRLWESCSLDWRWALDLQETGGRSSSRYVPLAMIAAGMDEGAPGLWVGLEWSANWAINMRLDRDTGIYTLAAGVTLHNPVIAPGETLSLPPVHLGFFQEGFTSGTNCLRRYLYHQICRRYQDQAPLPPVFYTLWGGIGVDTGYDEELLRAQVDLAAQLGIEWFVADDIWVDGGYRSAGFWQPEPQCWPRGLEPFARYVKSKGLGFGMSFSPEFSVAQAPVVQEHPEWFIELQHPDYLLDLRQTEAQDWLIELLCDYARRMELRWMRWDLGLSPRARIMPPMPAWDRADPTGKIQLGHVAGLYRVLDEVLARYPHIFFENNAGGGNRLDLGLMRRSHCHWMSDMHNVGHATRWMQARCNRFFPAHLLNASVNELGNAARDHPLAGAEPASEQYNDLAVLSRMMGGLGFNGRLTDWSPARVERTQYWIKVFKEIRHLLVKDFYQLAPQPSSLEDWDVLQFTDGEQGLVFAFRVEGSRHRGCFGLQAIDADRRYQLHDRGTGRRTVVDGHQLVEGFEIQLVPNSAKLWSYCPA